ncbi:ABC-F family ATP-binding cassette domain-containing protein [Haematomicrobium sanguinis]|uniref:ABC-F family ATP-binding cassette domain-containing protein n=1 Tax=Haematomicrobium sanguinis TaxID=479106 RepID=UPI00047BB42B|nr:ATP-binding cassette domain-containing protein [Haematomicrobium sanguinis]
MGHIDVGSIQYALPDGRQLLNGVTFRVGESHRAALIGPNGTGKTTLLRILAGELTPHAGAVTTSGTVGYMPQFIGSAGADMTVGDLLLLTATPAIKNAALALARSEEAMMVEDTEKTQMAYANALADWADVGGYDQQTQWDLVTHHALGIDYDRAQYRNAATLSGGEQKRLFLQALFTSHHDVLLLDEPDNYLDVPSKLWLERQLQETDKSVLFISHDRALIAGAASRIITLEPGKAGASSWTHGGGFATYFEAREDRNAKLAERRLRWDEEQQKLRELMLMYKNKAAYNSDMASRYQAAKTRLERFEAAGPPEEVPLAQKVSMRLSGGRTGKRAIVVSNLELTGLMKPFNAEIWFGDRVAILGSNGSGKSHFMRLLASGGTAPESEHLPVSEIEIDPVEHSGTAKLGARVRPGYFAQTHVRKDLSARTLIDILHRGDERRAGMGREQAGRVLDRYGLARQAEQTYDSLSGGQQARLQILLLELSGATLLLLDEPTDNLDIDSSEALEAAIAAFEGTVLAVTHDRWFANEFERFLVFGEDGNVYESDAPVWNEARVARER